MIFRSLSMGFLIVSFLSSLSYTEAMEEIMKGRQDEKPLKKPLILKTFSYDVMREMFGKERLKVYKGRSSEEWRVVQFSNFTGQKIVIQFVKFYHWGLPSLDPFFIYEAGSGPDRITSREHPTTLKDGEKYWISSVDDSRNPTDWHEEKKVFIDNSAGQLAGFTLSYETPKENRQLTFEFPFWKGYGESFFNISFSPNLIKRIEKELQTNEIETKLKRQEELKQKELEAGEELAKSLAQAKLQKEKEELAKLQTNNAEESKQTSGQKPKTKTKK